MKKKYILLVYSLALSASLNAQTLQQQFITTDVVQFWKAWDNINSTTDTLLQQQYLQEIFIQPCTEGQKALMEVRRYSTAEYLQSIRQHPRFWQSIRANTLGISTHFPAIQNAVQQLQQLYPSLQPVPIYFGIGIFRTNGTIRDGKVLIGSEMALSSKAVDISELPEHPKSFNTRHNPVDDLVFLCTHEYVHTQQKELVDNLLSYCLYEGVAEFVASVASGQKPYTSAIGYSEQHYEQVRDKFETDLFITYRTFDWMWSSRTVLGERDLGYGVGFGMAKQYYEKAADKQQAMATLIELDYTDEAAVEKLVDASGYLSRPLETLFQQYQASRPFVTHVSGVENGGQNVPAGPATITVHFSEALNGYNTGVDYGSGGASTFPKIAPERTWSDDKKSWTLRADLEPGKHYQILISNNFRLENGVQLKPFLLEFRTAGQ